MAKFDLMSWRLKDAAVWFRDILIISVLFWGWLHSGYMCYAGIDYPLQLDTIFRPCGFFIINVLAILILIFIPIIAMF